MHVPPVYGLNVEAFESTSRAATSFRINQRTLINRQDANQARPASRSIGGSPETFRSCSPQMEIPRRAMNACLPCARTCIYAHVVRVCVCVCGHGQLQRSVLQQGYPRLWPTLSSFEIERRSCEDWKAAIPRCRPAEMPGG